MRSSTATTRRPRGPRSSGSSRNRLLFSNTDFMLIDPGMTAPRPSPGPPSLALALYDEVALHLLVERRAEVRAVVREDARLVGLERDGLRLPRIHDDVDVVVEEPEAVQLVRRLLDVRHDDLDRVALVYLDGLRRDRRAHEDDLGEDVRALARDDRVLDVPDRVRVLVLFLRVDLDRVDRLRRDDLRVVGLRLRERVVEELHLLLGDVHELRGLGLRRPDGEVPAVRELVQADEVLALRRAGVALGGRSSTTSGSCQRPPRYPSSTSRSRCRRRARCTRSRRGRTACAAARVP